MDLMMPECDGLEAAKTIHQMMPGKNRYADCL